MCRLIVRVATLDADASRTPDDAPDTRTSVVSFSLSPPLGLMTPDADAPRTPEDVPANRTSGVSLSLSPPPLSLVTPDADTSRTPDDAPDTRPDADAQMTPDADALMTPDGVQAIRTSPPRSGPPQDLLRVVSLLLSLPLSRQQKLRGLWTVYFGSSQL